MSSEKPRFIQVTDEAEIGEIIQGGLGVPFLHRRADTTCWVDANELRAWRNLQRKELRHE